MAITKKQLDAMAAIRAKRGAKGGAKVTHGAPPESEWPTPQKVSGRPPRLGDWLGYSGKRYMPQGTSLADFSRHVGVSVERLESFAVGGTLAGIERCGGGWIRCTPLPPYKQESRR